MREVEPSLFSFSGPTPILLSVSLVLELWAWACFDEAPRLDAPCPAYTDREPRAPLLVKRSEAIACRPILFSGARTCYIGVLFDRGSDWHVFFRLKEMI